MISVIMKNTFPGLLIVWVWFFSEWIFSGVEHNGLEKTYYIQELKIFISYTALGLIAGGLSSGILAVKKKKYAYFFENDIKKYLKYFYKNLIFSVLIIFILLSREIINQPLLFKNSLLSGSFWFSGFFIFLSENFSPLYFTAFFVLIIGMSIHNLAVNLSIYQGAKRITGYASAIIAAVILIFNFGYLNAQNKIQGKNLIFIGVENLSREHLSSKALKNRPGLTELRSSGYDFVNCFSVSKDPRISLLSILTSIHPEKGNYLDGFKSYGLENRTIFSYLSKNGYNSAVFSDRKFTYNGFDEGNESLVKYPDRTEILKSALISRHCLLPVIINNNFMINNFSEIFLQDDYSDRTYVKNRISHIIDDKTKPFFILYALSERKNALPFPYYRLETENESDAFLTFLDDEISEIFSELKKKKRFDDTVVCLFGLPGYEDGIEIANYKIPFLMRAADFKTYRTVKNDYSSLDILPTVLDAINFDNKPGNLDGTSFFEPEFIRQDIIISDFSTLKSEDMLIFKDDEGYVSKNTDLQKQLYPTISRAIIRGDYKLNVISTEIGIRYELFDIISDPGEKENVADKNGTIVRKMRSIYEEKLNKEFNFKIINGYAFK